MDKIYFLIDVKIPLSLYEKDYILSNYTDIIFVSENKILATKILKKIFDFDFKIISFFNFSKLKNIKVFYNDAMNYIENIAKIKLANFIFLNKDVYYKNINNFISNEKILLSYDLINPVLYDEIKSKYVKEKRFLHSLNVAYLALKISYFQNKKINLKNIFLAGIFHDIAKDFNTEELNILSRKNKYYVESDEFALHQFVGAEIYKNIIEKYYKFNNDIYSSISFHCTGKRNMNLFGKIIFYSDKYEPIRYINNNDKISFVVQSIYNSYINFNQAFKDFIQDQIEYFNKKNIDYKSNFYASKFYDFELKK